MELDYSLIGKRIAGKRNQLKLTQEKLSEEIGSSPSYISNIERAVSIPSTETIMKLALALDTTPDEFLVGTSKQEDARWRDTAQRLRTLNDKQLGLVDHFLDWLSGQNLDNV